MQDIETRVDARWVIPIESPTGQAPGQIMGTRDRVLEHHSVAIREGRIIAVLPTTDAQAQFRPREIVTLPEHALLPGLVNAHTHAAMSLFRGMSDDLPLMDWLQQHIWPAEARHVSEAFVRDGTELAVAEMLRSGTTCFSDMYYWPEETARVVERTGMRARVGLILLDFPTAYAPGPDGYIERGLKLLDELRHSERVRCAFAPHAPYTVSDGPLARLVTINGELDLPIHMHVHETAHEVAEAMKHCGDHPRARPLARLDRLGLLSGNFIAVHMTQLSDPEIARLAETGVHVAHCPESNLKLASGFCPVHRLQQAGVNVALGTDGAASNNDLDMLGELRTAALLAKAVSNDATALPAHDALVMATLNGARALGLADVIGSLIPGKAADLIAIDLSAAATQPVYDPVSQIVYAATRDQVSDVWVAGRRLLADRHLTTLNEADCLARARAWRDRMHSTTSRAQPEAVEP